MKNEFAQLVADIAKALAVALLAGIIIGLIWLYTLISANPDILIYIGLAIVGIAALLWVIAVVRAAPEWFRQATIAAQGAAEAKRIVAEAKLLDSQGKKWKAEAALLLAQARAEQLRGEFFLIGRDALPLHHSNVDHRAAYYLVDKDIEMRSRPRAITWNQSLLPGAQNGLPAVVPSFAQLWESGQIQPGRLLFGFGEDGKPLLADWSGCYHLAVSGKTGMGKTNSEALIAAQMALGTFKLALIDSHGDTDGSLVQKLLPLHQTFFTAPAIEEDEILSLAKLIRAELAQRRKVAGTKHQKILLLVDEATGLLNRSSIAAELGPMLEEILQEGRKMGIFLMQSGQIWSAARTGGNTAMRSSFASALVHRTDADQARMLIPTDYAKEATSFAPGQAVFMDNHGDCHKISVPLIQPGDVELIADHIATKADGTKRYEVQNPHFLDTSGTLPQRQIGTSTEAVGDEAGSENGSDNYTSTTLVVDSIRAARVRAAIKSGMSKPEIIKDVWGFESGKGGRKYVQASNEYDEIVRALVQ